MRELEKLFKGLADVTRLRILNLLLHGELCVCDVQHVVGALQPNISRHLTYLKNSGLVIDRRDGPRICYRLAEPTDGARKQLFSFLQAPSSKILRSPATLGSSGKPLRAGNAMPSNGGRTQGSIACTATWSNLRSGATMAQAKPCCEISDARKWGQFSNLTT